MRSFADISELYSHCLKYNFGLKFNNIEGDDEVEDKNKDLESVTVDPVLEQEIVSHKIVSLADFRKNRDKKS